MGCPMYQLASFPAGPLWGLIPASLPHNYYRLGGTKPLVSG